jgi:hypothetical protein
MNFDFVLGLVGLAVGVVGLAGLFSEKHRGSWIVIALIASGIVCLGFVWGKSYFEDAREKGLIEDAKNKCLTFSIKAVLKAFLLMVIQALTSN